MLIYASIKLGKLKSLFDCSIAKLLTYLLAGTMKQFNNKNNIVMLVFKRLTLSIFATIFLFALFILTLTNPVHAAATDCPDSPNAKIIRNKYSLEAIAKGIFDSAVFNGDQLAFSSVDSGFMLLSGCSLLHPETNSATAGQGALAAGGRLISVFYLAPPASGVQYFADQFQKFNPVQPAYAQGIGFRALDPIADTWRKFRDASYVGFIIVFVVIGFMIMFRAKISPQAVATVQDTLPRVVIALILVTFSYALAGLMIDLMFLILNIVIGLLGLGTRSNIIFEESIIGVIIRSWPQVFVGVTTALVSLIDTALAGIPVLGGLGGGILGIIAGIALLFVMVRVFFMLLMAYISIILLTIFAPFFFLIQALPGNNGAMAWFRQMAANVSTFVVVGIMILLAAFIGNIGTIGAHDFSTGPDLSKEVIKFPLLTGGFDPGAIGRLIAFGFLLITPGAAQMVKEFLGVKGIGGVGAGFAAAGAAAGVVYTGSTARGQVGGIQAGLRTYQAERGERMLQRLPFIGGTIRARRELLRGRTEGTQT